MKTVSISEAKATLSEQIRRVARGEEVIILDRGRPVARLVGIAPEDRDAELDELSRLGLVRRGGLLPAAFWELAAPADPEGAVRAAVLAEREESR